MAQTKSIMLPLGTPAPEFSLPDTSGQEISLSDFQNKPLLVIFMCNHCPFVKHIQPELARLGKEYQEKGVGVVGISSNSVETHPADSPEKMKEEAAKAGYTFAYLYDETQDVAKAYQATCTPDFFLFDKDHKLVYRGQLDSSRPGNSLPVTGEDLRSALEAILSGQLVNSNQRPSIGCNIKWKPGNEPTYWS